MSAQNLVSRRTFLTAVAGAGALAGLTACGSSGPGGGGSTAQLWTLANAALDPLLKKAVDDFNSSAKVKLNIVKVPATQNMNEKIRTAMGSPNKPDLFFNWGGGSIRDYAQSDRLVDLTPKLSADTAWRDSFIKSVLDAGQIDGKYYDIPMKGMQPVVLFYNKTMFAQNNLKPPTTWDDLLGLVDAFKAKSITPIVLGGADSWTELMYLEFLVDRLGGATVFQDIADGKPNAWQNPVVLESLKMIRTLVDRGAFGPNYSSVGFGNGSASALFAQGKAAMHLMGTWEYTGQVNSAPDFAKNDLAFTNFPSVPNGKGDPASVVGNPTNYFAVTKSDRSSACVDFLKTQLTSDSYVTGLIKAGDIPAINGIEDKLSAAPSPEFAKAIYTMVAQAPTFTLSWDQALKIDVGQDVVTNLQKVFNKQIQPEDFVSKMSAS